MSTTTVLRRMIVTASKDDNGDEDNDSISNTDKQHTPSKSKLHTSSLVETIHRTAHASHDTIIHAPRIKQTMNISKDTSEQIKINYAVFSLSLLLLFFCSVLFLGRNFSGGNKLWPCIAELQQESNQKSSTIDELNIYIYEGRQGEGQRIA